MNYFRFFTSSSTYSAPKMTLICFHHTSRSSHLPSVVPSIVAAFFWLVVVYSFVNQQPSKATTYFIFNLFCRIIRRPK